MKSVEIIYRYCAQTEPVRPRPADSDTARLRLDEGNQAFAALLESMASDEAVARRVIQVDSRDFGLAGGSRESPKQRPFAAVLGCSDARVPVELIFNEGPNDLFVIRVAGNSLGSDVLGSLSYAVEHLGGSIKLIAVLGHSGCGAVSAAVDIFLDPRRYFEHAANHSLRGILDRMLVVVQASAKRMLEIFGPDVAQYPGYRAALIEAAIVVNAALAAYTVNKELKNQEFGDIKAVYGVYVVESREVWSPHRGTAMWSGLADPPIDPESFTELGNAVLNSNRILSILKAE
ncbi:carbonic anhydrase [Rhodoblastus sp.]|uniref:carbonic anhydrase n=1 Tax=Rhodoblastus sp. TaxID=1962975 RepID=UPI003F9BEF25